MAVAPKSPNPYALLRSSRTTDNQVDPMRGAASSGSCKRDPSTKQCTTNNRNRRNNMNKIPSTAKQTTDNLVPIKPIA